MGDGFSSLEVDECRPLDRHAGSAISSITFVVETEDLTVVNGHVYGSIIDDDYTRDGDDLAVTIADIKDYRHLLLQIRFGVTAATDPKIVIEGDDDAGNYHRIPEHTTPEEQQDAWTICEGTNSTTHIVAMMELTNSLSIESNDNFRPAITHAVVSEARAERRFENPIESSGYDINRSGSYQIELRDIRDGEIGELVVRGVNV